MQVTAAAESLMALGVGAVLVKLGSDGSLLLPGPGRPAVRQHALKADKVVDTTGGWTGACWDAARGGGRGTGRGSGGGIGREGVWAGR